MKTLILPSSLALAAAFLPAGTTLDTRYEADQVLRVAIETRFDLETTEMTMERDGEPMDRGGRGGMSSSEVRSVVHVDTIVAVADGKPTHVRRTFESAGAETSMEFGENGSEDQRDSPLDGVTIEVSVDDDGDVVTEVVEGSEPDDESLLEGHLLELAFDSILPAGDVEEGAEWDLDGDAIQRALGLHVNLFPPPERGERPEGGGERRRGGGGRGGRGGFRGGGGAANLFKAGEWEGTAKLAGMEDSDDGRIAVIHIEIECEGELAEPEREGGRGGRGFLAFPELGAERLLDTTFEIQIEGKLTFSLDKNRPVALDLEGKIATEREIERSFGESTMNIYTAQEGEFALEVRVQSE